MASLYPGSGAPSTRSHVSGSGSRKELGAGEDYGLRTRGVDRYGTSGSGSGGKRGVLLGSLPTPIFLLDLTPTCLLSPLSCYGRNLEPSRHHENCLSSPSPRSTPLYLSPFEPNHMCSKRTQTSCRVYIQVPHRPRWR